MHIIYRTKILIAKYFQDKIECDAVKLEENMTTINSAYNEFKSLKDPLCEDHVYLEHVNSINDKWKSTIDKLNQKLSQLTVSYIMFNNKCLIHN